MGEIGKTIKFSKIATSYLVTAMQSSGNTYTCPPPGPSCNLWQESRPLRKNANDQIVPGKYATCQCHIRIEVWSDNCDNGYTDNTSWQIQL